MMPTDQEYQSHLVFNELDRYIAFYESLAHSIFPLVTIGTTAISNIDSYVFSSIQGTLTSIRTILRDGKLNDAYALLRKYYDSAIITIYTNLYLEENVGIANLIVQKIDNWLKGEDKLPDYRVMSAFIRKSPKVATITNLLFSNDRYKQLRDRCNDHTHYNFYKYVLLNDSNMHLPNRRMALNDFSVDLRDVIILHLSYLFFAKPYYMASSDYLDDLEYGLTPQPDSQYWVAPFVQEVFDEILVQHRPDIAKVIKDHTYMRLK